MRALSISTGVLLSVLIFSSVASPAKRNKALEERRDKRLAAEAAAAAAAAAAKAVNIATASTRHLAASSESSEQLPILGQTARQRDMLLRADTASSKASQARLKAVLGPHTPTRANQQALVRPSLSPRLVHSNSMPKRVIVKIGGKPIEGTGSGDSSRSSPVSSASSGSDYDPSTTIGLSHSNVKSYPRPATSSRAALSSERSYSSNVSFGGSFGGSSSPMPKARPAETTPVGFKIEQASAMTLPKTRFRPNPNSPVNEQKKDYFERVFKEHNLGIHMPAHALADDIKMMSAAGLDPNKAKILFRQKIKDLPSQDYHDQFADRVRQWNSAAGNSKKILLAKDPLFAQLSEEEQRERVYQRASRILEENKVGKYRAKVAMGLRKPNRLCRHKKELKKRRQTRIEEIGAAFRKHLAKKDLNFDSISVEQMESESRHLSHPDVKDVTYPKYLLAYISKYRSPSEIMRFRNIRLRANTDKSHKLTRGQFRQDNDTNSES